MWHRFSGALWMSFHACFCLYYTSDVIGDRHDVVYSVYYGATAEARD